MNAKEEAKMQLRLKTLNGLFGKDPTFDFMLSGKRIRLENTNDPYTRLKKGDEGTVELIKKNEGLKFDQMWVQWDSGSTLMLIDETSYGRDKKDEFEIIGALRGYE